jgi:DNA-directed RNA polymerase sigma subunit (sigma70/sigma32)
MTQATYEEIAKEMDMTPSGVRKLEQRALRKVRKELSKRGMTLDDILPTETHFEPEQTPWDTPEI